MPGYQTDIQTLVLKDLKKQQKEIQEKINQLTLREVKKVVKWNSFQIRSSKEYIDPSKELSDLKQEVSLQVNFTAKLQWELLEFFLANLDPPCKCPGCLQHSKERDQHVADTLFADINLFTILLQELKHVRDTLGLLVHGLD